MDSLFSQRWYRVAGIHPRLRSHVRVSRHVYRDQAWYLLQDTSTGRNHRVDESTFHFIGRMDGQRSTDEIWHSLLNQLGEKTPTQDETIEILCQLSDNDLLQCEITPNVAELFRRRLEKNRKRRIAMLNPLAFRVPLFDPDKLLERLAPLGRALVQPLSILIWAAVIVMGLVSAALNWESIRAFASVHMLTPKFLLLMWGLYPLVKAIHELGHGLAVKGWGGEVRETGVSLLVLVPVPFVDASAASAFPEKYRRVLVSAAGIMVELLLAALALMLWVNIEDGLLRDMAFVVIVIGGVSTLMFNGNPLLRFDGYFVLSDALDIPNLGPRSTQYIAYLAQRYLLKLDTATSPVTGKGEAPLLFLYALASFCYRWFVSVLIVLWAGAYSFWLGVIAGALVALSMLIKPLHNMVQYLRTAPQLARSRSRAYAVVGGITAGLLVALLVVPMPFSTIAEGVVWLPEQARVRAETGGFVTEVYAHDGQEVKPGDLLLTLSDPELNAKLAAAQARLAALDIEYNRLLDIDAGRARSTMEDIISARAELQEVQRRLAALNVTSAVEGRLVMPREQDLPGSYIARGAVIAHVLRDEDISVKVAVPQQDAGMIRGNTRKVQVSLVDQPGQTLNAQLAGEVPAATAVLPTAALGDRAGGPVTTDPTDKEGTRTLEPVFLFDVRVTDKPLQRVGGRVWVRFDHGARPLGIQLQRRLMQLFLKQFNPQT